MKRVLMVIGQVRRWAIGNRARGLAEMLSPNYEIEVVGKSQLPLDPSVYHVIHLHTPCLLPDIITAPGYMEHPCWGFEVISVRSNAHLAKCSEAVKRASFCIAKNPRLIDIAKPYVKDNCILKYIPNGVDERTFFPPPIYIGWCGNKRPASMEYKGVALIEQAVSQLKSQWGKYLHVEFVTDPGDSPERILKQQEIAPWYRTLSAYVGASEGEGCSNTVIEALASGVPVVSTNTGIIPELAKQCDVCVVERTVEGIVEGLKKVLGPIVQRRQIAMDNYRWKLIADQYDDVYQEALLL